MYYPTIVAFFAKKVGIEEAKERLFQIGQVVAQKILEFWNPKAKNIENLIKKMFKKIWKQKVQIKKNRDQSKVVYRIIDKDCRICDPEATIIGSKIPCITISGYIDTFLQHFTKGTPLSSYQVRTVKSVSVGDEFCEHQIEVPS